MSETRPAGGFSSSYTLIFTLVLCSICAVILAAMASGLKQAQEQAVELDRHKQLLIASHLLSPEGELLSIDKQGSWHRARMTADGKLLLADHFSPATDEQIEKLFAQRVRPMLTDRQGRLYSPQELGIDADTFFAQHQKTGFAQLEHKLLYIILAQDSEDLEKPFGYIIPVNGFGLWGPIYGYLAIQSDAKTVLGISWYQHGETPGLGANIAEPKWQAQFLGKQIFQTDRSGHVDCASSPIGLVVIKGKVHEVFGDDPRSRSAVDGMTGATITGNGVSRAYKDVLEQYRPFLLTRLGAKPLDTP